MDNVNCCRCQKVVTDGVNGNVIPPAPWSPDDCLSAECFECENRLDEEHDQEQLEVLAQAARVRIPEDDCINEDDIERMSGRTEEVEKPYVGCPF